MDDFNTVRRCSMKMFHQVLRVALAATSCVVMATGVAHADTVQVKADLLPSSEVPPNTTSGHGDLTGTYDTATKKLQWKVNYDGLSGPATMAHFHGPAPVGKNAKVVVPIDKAALEKTSFEGQATLTADQAKQLMAGDWYFNIHTAKNPGGEIRGQVMH
jgi:hypothetical protein